MVATSWVRRGGCDERSETFGVVALLRSTNPELYRKVGRTVMEEAQERDHAEGF